MKRYAIALLFLIAATVARGQHVTSVNMCALLMKPAAYDSTRVQVRGYAVSDINNIVLFANADHELGIEVNIDDEVMKNNSRAREFFIESFKATTGGPMVVATITGIFHNTSGKKYITLESVQFQLTDKGDGGN